MINYFKISDDIGCGFITHEDREILGLRFLVVDNLIKVEGHDMNIGIWSHEKKLEQSDEKTFVDLINYYKNLPIVIGG